jgi:hypothetical protein
MQRPGRGIPLRCPIVAAVTAMHVADLRHFLDMLDDEPAPAKRLAVRLSAIVR